MGPAVAAIAVVLVIAAAFGLLFWRLRQGEQPTPTSWGKQLRRRRRD